MNQKKESFAILSEMIEMAKADYVIKETEYAFLLGIALELGVSKKTVDELIENTPTNLSDTSPKNRVLQFHRLIALMNIDGEQHRLEKEKLQVMGLRMGIKPSVVLGLLKEVENHHGGMLSIETLSKYIK